jgi:hypothetical protein
MVPILSSRRLLDSAHAHTVTVPRKNRSCVGSKNPAEIDAPLRGSYRRGAERSPR